MFLSTSICRMLKTLWANEWSCEAATICSVTTLVSSRTLSEAYAIGYPCRFVVWSSGSVAKTDNRRCLLHRRMWSTFFLLSWWHQRLTQTALTLVFFRSYSIFRVSLSLMTLWSKSDSVWRWLIMTWHSGRLRSFWSSFNSLGTISLQNLQIFGDNLPNTVRIHILLTCYNLISQSTIATHNPSYQPDVETTACGMPLVPGILFA